MATILCHSNFCIWYYSKEISLAEIAPSTIETIMSILQKEFFLGGGNIYFSTIKSEGVQKKKIASTNCTMV